MCASHRCYQNPEKYEFFSARSSWETKWNLVSRDNISCVGSKKKQSMENQRGNNDKITGSKRCRGRNIADISETVLRIDKREDFCIETRD